MLCQILCNGNVDDKVPHYSFSAIFGRDVVSFLNKLAAVLLYAGN